MMKSVWRAAAAIATWGLVTAGPACPAETVDFSRQVRPILADQCFQCHGPDEQQRQGSLRLDTPEGALARSDSGAAIEPGKPAQSELWRRITSTDPDERMPPAETGRKLTPEQIDTLRRWIEAGAAYEKHWAFTPPQRTQAPHLHRAGASPVENPIDAFVFARLAAEKLSPAPPADPARLLRRVTLDLTGLPPTSDEAAAFLADQSPDAYERAVDRLLASPRYGERMAVPWLNAARYADTSGYQSDGERIMWRWRDWVIEALNAGMPFDRFTVEQLAGDLLPGATLDQWLATGFNRNHRGNGEGGIIPEEYAVEYVVDRVETTSTVWLGLTLGCARCHDHKFDPFSQRDFYSLFALFNNIAEKGRAIKIGNSPPYLLTPTREQAEELARRERELAEATVAVHPIAQSVVLGPGEWERDAKGKEIPDWQRTEDLVAHFALDGHTLASGGHQPFDGEAIQPHREADASRSPDDSPHFVAGRQGQAVAFTGETAIEAGDIANFGFFDKFALSAWVHLPEGAGGGTVISRMTDVPQGDGYQLAIVGGKLQLNLVKRWLDDAIRVETSNPLPAGKDWMHVAATYDGSRTAGGIKLYIDGQPQQLNVLLDELNQTFSTKQPLRIGGGGGAEMRFRGSIDEVRVYSYDLAPDAVLALAAGKPVADILKLPQDHRTPAQRAKLLACYYDQYAPENERAARRRMERLTRQLRAFRESLPTTMVMQELPEPRPAHVLIRGQYDRPGEPVQPSVPQQLLPWKSDLPRNRLGLAQWLVDPAHPLTARVAVNRSWQLFFGRGLVETTEDWGLQGQLPTHPQLLDWLAVEFQLGRKSKVESRNSASHGWDVKRLHRLIVASGTYRQSSRVTPELLKRDPDNRLLARGPRLRLSAEMVRDQALAASGLLVERLGGPSVKPRQPAGLWAELTGGEDYVPGSGADLYRRSLYTFWKRTIPPPAMTAFDATSREFCSVRESRTNTPLQALALLNDELYVEAAQALASQVMCDAESSAARVRLAFQCVLAREPTQRELQILIAALERHFQKVEERQAYELICATILNLDEAVMKE